MGKSTCDNPESCRKFIVGPLDDISVDIRSIRDLVSTLLQGWKIPPPPFIHIWPALILRGT